MFGNADRKGHIGLPTRQDEAAHPILTSASEMAENDFPCASGPFLRNQVSRQLSWLLAHAKARKCELQTLPIAIQQTDLIHDCAESLRT